MLLDQKLLDCRIKRQGDSNQSIYASINIGHSVHIFSQFTIEINIETKNSLTPIVNFTQNSNIIKLNATLKGIIKI